MPLHCNWCFCLVMSQTPIDCDDGSRQAMYLAARGADRAGKIFLSECYDKDEESLVDLQTKCKQPVKPE